MLLWKVGNNSIILPWTCISYYFLNDFYEVRLKNAVATHWKNIHTVHKSRKGLESIKFSFGMLYQYENPDIFYVFFKIAKIMWF